MSRKKWMLLGLVLTVVLIGGLVGAIALIDTLPQRLSQHETIVLGQARLVPGSTAAMRVVVRDSRDATPLPGARVKVLLRSAEASRTLYEGEADASGALDVSFAVPDDVDGAQTLVVETSSSLGADRLEKPVTLARDHRLLVSTDKPLYQPGQVIHVRILALGAFDRIPARDAGVVLTIADGKGNTVFREALMTSSFGVAATDFQLADEVNTGPYKITATLAETTSEKTVTVEPYALPKFEVELTTERSFYRPGEHVAGTLSAWYFYGKPVAGGQVVLEFTTFDVEQTVIATIEGETDAEGRLDVGFDLPGYLVGSDLDDGRGRIYLEARVTDLAEHTEVGRLSLPVSTYALVVDAVPEGGLLREGVENILYLLTSTPDGAPVEADVRVRFDDTGEELAARTGTHGLGELRFTPRGSFTSLTLTARDATGAEGVRHLGFDGTGGEETVLLRPDGALYRVGETLGLTVLTSQPRGVAYLDIVREGQTVSTRAVDIEGGRGEVVVDLTPDLYGTLELHAYKILSDGRIIRDMRLVVVDDAADLMVDLAPGAESYHPGEEATLDVQVRDGNGAGLQAAVGLAIVDEAVFALAEQDPGFAKLYFMLEQELLVPKIELHGFSIPDLVRDPCVTGDETGCSASLREARSGAGRAALASAVVADVDPYTLAENSHDQTVERAATRQRALYRGVAGTAFGLMLLVPLVALALSGGAAIHRKVFWRSLGPAVLAVVVAALSLAVIEWVTSLFTWRVRELAVAAVAGAAVLAGLAGLLVLLVVTIRRRDAITGAMLALLPSLVPLLVVLGWSVEGGRITPDDWMIAAGLVAVMLLALAMLLRAMGLLWERRTVAGVGALALGLLLFGLVVPVVAVGLTLGQATGGMALGRGEMLAGAPPMAMEFAVDEAVWAEKEEAAVLAEAQTPGAGVPAEREAPRLRQYFPETMLWLPGEITDAEGHMVVDFAVADSITTWRVAALASSQDGRLGSATGALRVFQDFFIDLDFPASLTVGDEVSVPVGVFNYLPEAQSVRLEVEPAPWFELLDDAEKEIHIAANDITVVTFRIRALDFGQQPFQVAAYGSRLSDAIRRQVRVFPDGKPYRFSVSDRLSPTVPVEVPVPLPTETIPGTQSLMVKIYPGVVSQVVEGLDALLRMPYGCFEQTSSTTYPNVLVLDYLKTAGQVSPEVQMKAEEYINLGYQRLTTFEVPGEPGGFSLFGDAPADPMLTAYGLQEFGDMSRVANVDPALIERVAGWLIDRQAGDGSWQGVEGFHETSITGLTERVPVTAWIVWGLADAGYADHAATQAGASFLREHLSEAENAYDLAMVANALVAVDIKTGGITDATEAVLARLAGLAQHDGEAAFWEAGRETYMGGYGISGQLEVTASAALALLRAGRQPELAHAALTFLVRSKDSFGTWETTSATVMALKAFVESVRSGAEDVDATVVVSVDGSRERTLRVTPETFDVVQSIVYEDLPLGRDTTVGITVEGEGNLMYQVTASGYLPWDRVTAYPELLPAGELVTIDVAYDRTELAVDDTVEVSVAVRMQMPEGAAEQAIIDLGLPPGFTVETGDLARLVARFEDVPEDYEFAQVKRFELTGRQIILYVRNLSGMQPLTFSYRLRANFPLVAQTPASTAYDYYNPSTAADVAPLTLTVMGE